ncbi:MAG: sugar porter family MFS transporter, partial [Streblomastix strix]
MQIKSKHSNKKSLFISVLGGLSYGVPVATISGVLGEPKFEALSQAERAFISSSLMYGILIGTFLAFLLIDYFGRRKLIIFFGLESFLFALLLSAMDTPASIITMRLIQGIGVGAIQTISPIYSLELASDDWKGMFVLLFQVHITIGYIIGYTLNIIFNYVTDGWRYEFGLAGIPIFIYSVGTIFLTESDVYKKKNADNI